MLLRKRPRPPIRRTTSMTGLTSNVEILDSDHPPARQDHPDETVMINNNYTTSNSTDYGYAGNGYNSNYCDDHGRFLASMVLSPRNVHHHHQRSGMIEPANFLRTCGLCRRRLASGKDIYMYRGDTAFCSQECREKGIKEDEKNNREENHNGNS